MYNGSISTYVGVYSMASIKPTSKDVAKRAGVSQSTVSIVLNQRTDIQIPFETRQRVLQAAEDLCYTLPRHNRHTKLLAVMVPSMVNPFYPQLLNDIEQAAVEKNLRVISMNSRRSESIEADNLDYLSKQKLLGVVFAYTPFNSSKLEQFSQSVPVVLMGEEIADLKIDTVSFSSYRAGEIVANHLIDLGHKSIAFLSPPIDRTSHSRRKRLMGIQSAITKAGAQYKLDIIIDDAEAEEQYGNYELNVGYHLAQQAQKNSATTAWICVNDITAAGAIRAAWDAHLRVPDDIAIAGFDNLLYSSMLTPPLTSVEHHAPQRARLAVDMLLQRSGGKINGDPLNIEYYPTLIKRASTVPRT